VDPKKIEAMQDWIHPKTIKILRGFLGLIGYYHKLVRNYVNFTVPLTALLKNNSFTWTPIVDQSFQALKDAMYMTPVLSLPVFTNTFVLECDAFRKGNEEVLIQYGWPLAFTNKQISDKHLGESIYEKEMLDVVHVVNI
jgi:hypothetical protein